MALELSFLGGAGTVTGSKFLLEHGGKRLLIDCGLFQGLKVHRLKNWEKFPVAPGSIAAVVLTHAHIDHTGYLPLLVKNGFRGPVFCTAATKDLCGILLPDCGHLQEKDAEFANRHGFSRHKPAMPLYTREDAESALRQFDAVAFDDAHALGEGATLRFRRAGHILGAATAEIDLVGMRVLFSGDLGRYNDPMMLDPVGIAAADYLVVESTYGSRIHSSADDDALLADVISRTTKRGGTVIIPAFAVGRAQLILFHLHKLRVEGRLSELIPIYLDSPMATDATEIFRAHPADHRLEPRVCLEVFKLAHYVRDVVESKALTANPMPKVIVSASGMASGGRVLHHLKQYAPDPRNAILFTGFQAAGTRGAAMVGGVDAVKIHGAYVPVRAEVVNLSMLSAHADQGEVLRWLKNLTTPPRRTFLVHGEPDSSDALRKRIEEELGWDCTVAEMRDRVTLT